MVIQKNQESIVEIHRLALAHRKAYESLCKLLVVKHILCQ